MPDRLVVLPGGKVGFAEMKRDSNSKPTKLQQAQIDFLNAIGCTAQIVNSEQEIDNFIKKVEGT